LHDQCRLPSDQSRSGTYAYSFFFAAQRHMLDLRIPLKLIDEIENVNVRETRDQVDSSLLDGCQDQCRPGFCVHFAH
jgi:hypothetical protein